MYESSSGILAVMQAKIQAQLAQQQAKAKDE